MVVFWGALSGEDDDMIFGPFFCRDGGSFAEILSYPSYNEVCGCKHVDDETACYIVKRCGVTMSGTVILIL